MLAKEIILVALAALRANALRSFLTALGIIIGVASVIAMVSLGGAAQNVVEDQVETMGTNILTIIPGQSRMGGVRFGGSSGQRLTLDDAEALRDRSGGLLRVSPEAGSRRQLSYLRANSSNDIAGVWPEFFEIHDLGLLVGRYFTRTEVEGRRRVAVLGYNVPGDLDMPAELLIGKRIQVGQQRVEVVGVLDEKGSRLSRSDDRVFVPVTTGIYRLFGGRERLSLISAATATPEDLDLAYAEVDRILRREHRIEPGGEADFSIVNAADLLQAFGELAQAFGYLLAGLAGISLLVGGIGIMNVMLVSVTERTREIGVRKALGATRRAILFQFLIEALVLCTIGGAMGVTAGWLGSRLINAVAPLETQVSPVAALGALVFSAGIGLFFGMYPAQRAARLDPIEALRHE